MDEMLLDRLAHRFVAPLCEECKIRQGGCMCGACIERAKIGLRAVHAEHWIHLERLVGAQDATLKLLTEHAKLLHERIQTLVSERVAEKPTGQVHFTKVQIGELKKFTCSRCTCGPKLCQRCRVCPWEVMCERLGFTDEEE